MMWIQITAVLLLGGLLLFALGLATTDPVIESVGFIAFMTGVLIMLFSFKEEDK